jgi:alkylation response protein AidB-like acyl-CoA dehydrogenase
MRIERNDAEKEAAELYGGLAKEFEGRTGEGLKALAAEGLLGLSSGEKGWSIAAPALEAVALADASLALAAAMNLLAADLVWRWGDCKATDTSENIEKGRVAAALIGPGRGPEAPSLVSESGRLALQGSAGRVCLAPVADLFVVLARRDDRVSLLSLPKDHPAISVGDSVDTIGMSGIPIAPVSLRFEEVTRNELCGPDPLPDSEPDALSARWSLCMAAVLCGCSLAALEEVRLFAQEHKAGDKPVFKHQAQSFHVADMFAALDAARLMLDRAAYAVDAADREAKVLCECARLVADDAVEEIAGKGSRLLGSRGAGAGVKFRSLIDDASVARFIGGHPDALLSSVFESIAEDL